MVAAMSASPESRPPAAILEENLEWIRAMARALVLLRGGQPVKTIPIRLHPGEVNRFEI